MRLSWRCRLPDDRTTGNGSSPNAGCLILKELGYIDLSVNRLSSS